MSILNHTPTFTADDALQLGQNLYAVNVQRVKLLASERDQNFLLTDDKNCRFVLKISNAAEALEFLQAQNQLLNHLETKIDFCPRILDSTAGNQIETASREDRQHYVRLVSFVEGTPLIDVGHQSNALMFDLGQRVGQLTNALDGFYDVCFARSFHWDLAVGCNVVHKNLQFIDDHVHRNRIERLLEQFRQHTEPLLPDLPKSIIHNDVNDGNVVCAHAAVGKLMPDSIAGFIDFGDAVHGWTIGELAIAIAYAILDKDDPLDVAIRIVAGYCTTRALTPPETDALFGLVCLRLCVSAAIAHEQKRARPDDPYLTISQAPIERTLPRLEKIPFRFAAACFRNASDILVLEHAERTLKWIRSRQHTFAFPLNPIATGERPDSSQLVVLDLSHNSRLLSQLPESAAEAEFTPLIFGEIEQQEAAIGIGRYLEPRLLYLADQFAADNGWSNEGRTIHLGIDLFAPAATPVITPLAGRVAINTVIDKPLDYGGLLILEHTTDDGDQFFTLYGHLEHSSLQYLEVGDSVERGQQIARLGEPAENGGWTPHLHFQLMLSLLDYAEFFPGVGHASRIDTWSQLSPDPNLILGIDHNLFPPDPPDKSQTLTQRRQHIGPSVSIGYQEPIKAVRGRRHFLSDETGRTYIDAYNNVPHVGHCHPAVVDAVTSQMRLLNTNTRYLHDNINQLAERLTATMPDGLDVCFFLSSASEANELALRLARTVTGQQNLIVTAGAYHGHSTTLIDISPYKHDGPGGAGRPNWVHATPLADVYRGKFRDPKTAGKHYADGVGEICQRLDGQLCGFIAESCPSVGGQIIFPNGYLQNVYRHVRAAGGICIADDVQTGYGRLGKYFYGFEQQSVTPDIVVLGKPIGNGHPLAAVVTTRKIADAFDNGMEFFATFGGNTVSCAAGLAVLDVLESEPLQENAADVGQLLLDELRLRKEKHSLIGDVRGSGFFLGVELVRDHSTLEPADLEASFISNRMRERGVLIGTDGPYHNVLKIRPPMTFDRDSAHELLRQLDRALVELSK